MWHNDYITEIEQEAAESWRPLVAIIAAIWAAIYGCAWLVWGAA